MGPARTEFMRTLTRNTLGSLAVAGVVALIAFGLPLFDRALPAGRAVAAGQPYAVGGRVTVVPPAGSTIDVTRTRPGTDRGTVLFVVEGVRLAIVVGPYRGSLDDAAARLHRKITKSTGYQVTGADEPITTAQGVVGLHGAYSSPGRLGAYAVFVSNQASVEVTASGPEQQLRGLENLLAQSLRTVIFQDHA
jgi:hypothetical protein